MAASKVLDAFIAYQFIKILSTPWHESKAFELGIIDERGKVLKRQRDLKTREEKAAYTMAHRLIWNIKRLLDKLPPTQTRIGSFASALWMLKEHHELTYGVDFTLTEKAFEKYLGHKNFLVEGEFPTDGRFIYLDKGVYKLKNSAIDGPGGSRAGDRIIVDRDQEMEGILFGAPVFLVLNSRTGQLLYVTSEDLVKA